MNALKKSLVTFVAVTVLLVQLLNPVRASADGETTPPPAETSDVTKPPAPTDVPTELVPTETPLVSDVLKVEPVSTDVPTITPLSEETATEIPVVESSTITPPESNKEPTLLEAIAEIPSETNIVVLDENSQPLSLTTQDTAQVVASGDPVWCPNSTAPGGSGCTSSYTSLASLLSYLSAQNSGTGVNSNGTIWIESSYNSSVNDPLSTSFILDGGTLTTWANYALTLQGGWGGFSNSVFNVPISILNWNNNVTVNRITINNATDGGLRVSTNDPNAKVNIDRVTVRGAHGFGLLVQANGGDVTVQNSTFRDTVTDYYVYYPYGDGADIFSNGGNVTISNSHFINNEPDGGGYGAWVSAGSTGNLTVNNSEFTDNYTGLSAFSSNDIYILNGNVFQNNLNGLTYSDCSGNLIIDSNITFAGNYTDISNWGGGCSDPIAYVSPANSILSLSTRTSGKFTLDCKSQGGFSVPLPNGDLVQIFCPVSGEAEIARLDNTILPKPLPDGYTYASAFELNILQSQKPITVINDAGYIKASFIASNLNSPGNGYGILYWDPIEKDWVVLKDYMRDGNGSRSFYLDPEDPTRIDLRRKIISGVQLVTSHRDERVEVSTNFPGIFVLAQH